MQIAAMQPLRLWVMHVAIQAHEEFHTASATRLLPYVSVGTQMEEGVDAGGNPLFRCVLNVATDADAPADAVPYTATIQVSGVFAFLDQGKLEGADRRRMVAFNGIAMLYGFARDVIAQYTALSAHGPLTLPALNITDLSERLLADAEAAPAARAPENGSPSIGASPARPGRKRRARGDDRPQ